MKREAQLAKKIAFVQNHTGGMTKDDAGNLVARIAAEYEDIIPTYKNVKDDAVSRFWEYAKRLGEPVVETFVEEPEVLPTPETAVVEVEDVVAPQVEVQAPQKPKRTRKPRAKKAPAAEE